MKVTVEGLSALQNYILADIRGERAFSFGHIPNAVCLSEEELLSMHETKTFVLYCKNGEESEQAARRLREAGKDADWLEGGFTKWMEVHRGDEISLSLRVEESLRRRFHRSLFSKFAQAIVTYHLVEEGDSIAVCISGGKDSFLMAKLFQELQRHGKFPFRLVFLTMDPGYSAQNRALIEANAKALGIPLTVFQSDIFESVLSVEKSPCYLCARMRRGHLYSKAKELGCNKIALGHHFDDVIETILMGMLYGGQMQTMMPKLDSTNFEGMKLIRPLYLVREEDIEAWRDANGLRFLQCACKFTASACEAGTSKRKKVKSLIRTLRQEDPEIEQNIFKSAENVNLATVIAYKDKHGVRHWFDEE